MAVNKGTGPVTRFRFNQVADGAPGPPGPPGAGVGTVTGSGFLHNTGGALDAAASHGAANQLLFGGNTDVLWAPPLGDVSLVGQTFTVTGIQGKGVSSTAPTEGQFLVFGASAWAPTSLSGDVSASSTTPGQTTVTAIQGRAVTTNAPAVNNVLGWTGSAWNPTAISSGMLPSLAGDVTGAYNANVVGGIQGHGITLATGYLQWTGTAWAFGAGGASITWANDLGTSSNLHQYVSSISGANGSGGAVPLSANAYITAAAGSDSYIDLSAAASGYGYIALGSSPPTSGLLRVGSVTGANNVLINSGTAPAYSQVLIQAGGTGGFSFLAYAAGNNQQGFDVDWNNNVWTARNSAVAWFVKSGNTLAVAGSVGNTIGASATQYVLEVFDLATGNFYPGQDNAYANGTVANRWGSVNAGQSGFRVWNNSTDTGAASALVSAALVFGPGGSSAVDTEITRAGAQTVQISNYGLTGNATLIVGSSTTHELLLASSNTSIDTGSNSDTLRLGTTNAGGWQLGNAGALTGEIVAEGIQFWASSAPTEVGLLQKSSSDYFAFGTAPAQSGNGIRATNGTVFATMRNVAGTGDLVALQSNSNNLLIGGTGSPSNIYQTVASGGTLGGFIDTSQVYSLGTSNSDYLALGTTPATAGFIRLTNTNGPVMTYGTGNWIALNIDGTNDFEIDSHAALNLGYGFATSITAGNSTTTASWTVSLTSAGTFLWQAGGLQVLAMSHSTSLPVSGTAGTLVAFGTQGAFTTSNNQLTFDSGTAELAFVSDTFVLWPSSLTRPILGGSGTAYDLYAGSDGGTTLGVTHPFGAVYFGANTTSGAGYFAWLPNAGTSGGSQKGKVITQTFFQSTTDHNAHGYSTLTMANSTGVTVRSRITARCTTAGTSLFLTQTVGAEGFVRGYVSGSGTWVVTGVTYTYWDGSTGLNSGTQWYTMTVTYASGVITVNWTKASETTDSHMDCQVTTTFDYC